MSLKTSDNLYTLLEKKYAQEFISNMNQLSSAFFDRNPVPWELRCTACNGTGDVGRNASRTCNICQGKRIAPIPSSELFPPEILKLENSFKGAFSKAKK